MANLLRLAFSFRLTNMASAIPADRKLSPKHPLARGAQPGIGRTGIGVGPAQVDIGRSTIPYLGQIHRLAWSVPNGPSMGWISFIVEQSEAQSQRVMHLRESGCAISSSPFDR